MRYFTVAFAVVGLFAGVATAHYHGDEPGNVRAVFVPYHGEDNGDNGEYGSDDFEAQDGHGGYADATGHVVLNAAEGKPQQRGPQNRGPHAEDDRGVTIVQVNVRGLKPNEDYEFNLTHGAPAEPFTTRGNGSANLHYELDGTHHVGHLPAKIWYTGGDEDGDDPILIADK